MVRVNNKELIYVLNNELINTLVIMNTISILLQDHWLTVTELWVIFLLMFITALTNANEG